MSSRSRIGVTGPAVTIEDELRPSPGDDGPADGPRRARPDHPSVRRDLERYAALFATRIREMKSSAMRDLMAITERPEIISLAGGFPDTSTFPPELFASTMETVGEGC